ncbi:MAG: AbrB/MazE/SpoVT family DNA-binding domain-containing protein [Hydrogenophaga sp.]|nr:AbrB/MazE/SpoVT family DNA-binding domain-containing protein [Hydrogenophaga sp.]
MSSTATLSKRFQITIPESVRTELHWEAGQEFVLLPKHDGVLLLPMPKMQALDGIAKGARKDGYRERKGRH